MAGKILLIEDEENILLLLNAVFEELGDVRILTAKDGEEGLRIARAENPDVIVLDIQLPKIDGYKVCQLLKAEPTTRHTRVVMLSGMTQHFDIIKAQEVGADDFITKPFTSAMMVDKVKELLRSKQDI